MAIVMNELCPACAETGHDSSGNHLMVFSDGNKLCTHSHWHKNGLPYFIPSGESDPILDMDITGKIKYTVDQFRELEEDGKLSTLALRSLAMSGMRGQDRWEVANQDERDLMVEEKDRDKAYYDMLTVRNLVDRHIPGQIAKLYGIKVGLDTNNKVARHYYPVYHRTTGEWLGAKCRELPKDFRFGSLGWLWGDNMLFGQNTLSNVLDSGSRMDTLLLVGGECDAAAAQTMLVDTDKGTRWEGKLFHVWSPTKGEYALQEILDNIEAIRKFNKVIVCFDDDEAGNKLNREVAKVLRGKCKKLVLPSGCKDPNDCLKQGRSKEFVDAWWKPVNPFEGGSLSGMGKYKKKAKETPEMGLSWPWESLNEVTYGIRLHYLSVWGAGTGVGKTKTTKEVVFEIAYRHKKPVVVIYLEEQPDKTVRSFAGNIINKDITAPPCNNRDEKGYTELRDYTKEQADEAIDKLCDDGMIMIGDMEGRKDVESVMELMEIAIAMGFEYFIIDNLTAFEHHDSNGNESTDVKAIDHTMRRLGTFKDENAVHIMLLSHLKKPFGDRTPHEEGGRVRMSDFRGSGSITFWANSVHGIERNTVADSMAEKCTTTYRCIKNRDVGHMNGHVFYAVLDKHTGRLTEINNPPVMKEESKKFDNGVEEKDF